MISIQPPNLKMIVDSNILIYAINADSPKHELAKKFLEENLDDLKIAHQNILETIRVLTHKKFLRPMKLKDALDSVMAISESLQIISPDEKTIYITLELIQNHKLSGNRIFDAYLAATALSNGDYDMATDNTKDFKKFTQIKALNPFK